MGFLVLGDSIAAFNTYPPFVDLFAPDWRLARRVAFKPPVPQPLVLGRLDNGRFVGKAQAGSQPPDAPGLFESTQQVLVYDAAGTLQDTLAIADPVLWWGTGRAYWGAPLRDGGGVAVGRDDVFVASGETYLVVAYAGMGGQVRTIRLDLPRRAVDPAIVDAWHALLERQRSQLPREPRPPGPPRAPRLADAPLPDSLPAVSRLLVDALGRLWARRCVFETDSLHQWDLFALDGTHLGTLRTPAALTIREIGEDYVLGVWRDELDVETVRLYAMRFP